MEDNKKSTVRISEDLKKALEKEKERSGTSLTYMVDKAVGDYLNSKKRKEE